MDTATASVIVSGAVAVGSIGATVWQHRRGLKQQRELADLENVRAVLDDAAAELHRAAYALDELRSSLTTLGAGYLHTERGTENFRELGDRARELDALAERLAVRFGRDHDVAATFTDADEAFLAIYRAVGAMRQLPNPDTTSSGEAQVRNLTDKKQDQIRTSRRGFDGARKRFIEAAHRAAGAQLQSAGIVPRVRLVREEPPAQ